MVKVAALATALALAYAVESIVNYFVRLAFANKQKEVDMSAVKIVSKKIRNSARGEDCTFHIVGLCNYNPETTVLCHLPSMDKGIGTKSDDICAAYGCSSCHDAIDRRVINEEFEDHREWYMRRAMVRTWRRLIDMGMVVVK